MELMRFALLLCLASQALSKPVKKRPVPNEQNPAKGPTIFELIIAANKGIPKNLIGGDIAIDPYRNTIKCKVCMWPKNKNGIVQVPYVLDSQYSASNVNLINNALKEFEVMTCVHFVSRSTEPNYLSIQSGDGCWSYIGRIGGKQTVSLNSPNCMSYGIIQHEAMHNLGFYHEHTRVDRDEHIYVVWENIVKAEWGNFAIVDGNTLNLPYDYQSVLHYNMYAYVIQPGFPALVPIPDPTVPIGQRIGMSTLDVNKINTFYNCSLCRQKLVKASGSLSGDSSTANRSGGNCLWLIQIPGNKISLTFNKLAISSTDYVKVYDGVTQSSPVLLDKTYGNGPITPLVSSGHNMLVEFVSKATSKSSTFKASYSTTA